MQNLLLKTPSNSQSISYLNIFWPRSIYFILNWNWKFWQWGKSDLYWTKIEKEYFPNLLESALCRQIFVFWDRDLKFWLQQLESSYVFLSPLKWQGRTWPILTLWIQNWHIWGKMQVHTIIPKSLFLEINEWNFGYSHIFRSP